MSDDTGRDDQPAPSPNAAPRALPSLYGRPLNWLVLSALTLVIVTVLEATGFPASVLLGGMVAAIIVALTGARLAVPATPYLAAQALVGCMIAQSLSVQVLHEIAADWPVFIAGVLSVIGAAAFLGWSLARLGVLPGSTAIWGSSPGAAQVMTILSENYGADMRLVAFMQYTRVIIVAGIAAGVARIWAEMGDGAPPPTPWFAAPDWGALVATLALVGATVLVNRLAHLPALSFIFPMIAGALLQDFGIIQLELPPLLLAAAFVAIGWGIGLRFDVDVLRHAAKALPRILIAIFCLVAACGALAALLVRFAGVDPLTAYLATSPGGADTVAIIAASGPTNIDVPFIMAMQIARFVVLVMIGPSIAKFITRRMLD